MDLPADPPIPFLDLPRQHHGLKDDLLRVLAGALDSAAFIGGHGVAAFEKEFADYLGIAHAVGISSGTDALRLAMLALGVEPGRPVITVPNTFVATAATITQTGARPEFVDVDPRTCLIDIDRLEDLLRRRVAGPAEDRPCGIVPVHLYGQCADMDAINALAQRYGLWVVEDACQAHGALYKGRKAGTLASMAAFSFYPGKNLGACGDAGAVTTADARLVDTIRTLRDHGQRQKYDHQLEGYNARLDAIQAGFLRVKLPMLDGWNRRRRELCRRYDTALAALPWIRTVQTCACNLSAHHLYVIHVPQRDALFDWMKQRGIACGLHYPVPLHLQPCYRRLGLGPASFPAAEWSAAHLVSLPLFPEMSFAQQERIIAALRAYGEIRKLTADDLNWPEPFRRAS